LACLLFSILAPAPPTSLETGGVTALLLAALIGLWQLVQYLIRRSLPPDAPRPRKDTDELVERTAAGVSRNVDQSIDRLCHQLELRDVKQAAQIQSLLEAQERLIQRMDGLLDRLAGRK